MASTVRSATILALGASAIVLAQIACGDSTTSEGTPDAGSSSFDASPKASDSSPPVTTKDDAGATGNDGGDSGDAGLKGTGLGLRVKILGAEWSYGGDDESSFRDLLAADTTLVPTRVEPVPTVDAALLSDADVVVLDNLSRNFTEAEAQALYDWVVAGHGLIALAGYGGSDTYKGTLLAKFDVNLTGGASGNQILVPLPGHAVVNGVSGLRFYGGSNVASTNDASVEFASYNGSPAGFATKHGLGRSVFYGDEWILLDVEVNRVDDAGAKPTHRFWHNALLWVGGRID